jgi:LPS-assembly protein
MKGDWELPANMQAKVDVDLVSDQDYLREFVTGHSGYEKSNASFKNTFSRELDDEEDTVRLNQLNVNRSWNSFSFNAGVQWQDDVIARKNSTPDDSLQKLPFFSFSGAKQKVGETAFYYDVSSSMTHNWRDQGTRGYVIDANPRLFYPTTILGALDFEPSVGFQETAWYVEENDQTSTNPKHEVRSREIPDFSGDLSTEISKIFDVAVTDIEKIRHAIKPRVVYTYVPDVEQDDLPDYVTAIDEQNTLSYTVTNTLTSKRKEKKEREAEVSDTGKGGDDVPGPFGSETAQQEGEDNPAESGLPEYVYHDFLRLDISQSYDILVARRPAVDGNERRPFSDVQGRLEWTPLYDIDLSLLGNVAWSPYTADYTSYDLKTEYTNSRKDALSLEYRYTRDSSESAQGRCLVHLYDTLAALWEHEYNLLENEVVNSGLGLTYTSQCWTFSLKYTHDRTINEREYYFELRLFGLGDYELGRYRPGD